MSLGGWVEGQSLTAAPAGPGGPEDPRPVPRDHLEGAPGPEAKPRLQHAAADSLQQQRSHGRRRGLRGAAAPAGHGGRALPRSPHHHHPQPRGPGRGRGARRLGRLRLRPPGLQVPQTAHQRGVHGERGQLSGADRPGRLPRCYRRGQRRGRSLQPGAGKPRWVAAASESPTGLGGGTPGCAGEAGRPPELC